MIIIIILTILILISFPILKTIISHLFNNEKEANLFLKVFTKDKELLESDYIDFKKKNEFKEKYCKKLECYKKLKYPIKSSAYPKIKEFNQIFVDYSNYVEVQNKKYIENQLEINKELFSDIDGKKLDKQQSIAVVTDEMNNLVIAGAGSGKTLTIVGKVKYLCEYKKVDPSEILLLSFTNKSANEMTNRINNKLGIKLEASTFHKLGLNIISRVKEKRDDVYESTEEFIKDFFDGDGKIFKNSELIQSLIEYFAYYLEIPSNLEDFNCLGDVYEHEKTIDFETLRSKYCQETYIKEKEELNKKSVKTIVGEKVKSIEEVTIANYLFLHGIEYRYEELYPFTEDNYRKPYRPDFYLPEYNIYIEHFGITRNNRCPWLSAVEEKKYIADMQWKRELHKKHETTLIESYSYYNSEGVLIEKLEENLLKNNVILKNRDFGEVFNKIYSKKSDKYFQEFIKLCNSFINLYKSNGFKAEEINELKFKIKKYNNSYYINRFEVFKKIIYSLLLDYELFLNENKMIDFADMIQMATGYISEGRVKLPYKYVIIDEFQDVSIGRYKLVKAILETTGAKLMCVGDDWQSIYRFAGSDISVFTKFKEFFGYSKIMKIETTYRNSQELINLASEFILKNPMQIDKKLTSNKRIESPIILCSFENTSISLSNSIDNIINEFGEEKNIMIIGRTMYDEKILVNSNLFETINTTEPALKRKNGKIIYKKNKNVDIEFITAHKSKGLEADNVIIINFENSILGFPNKISDDPILETVLSDSDSYMYSEERRLFYVSMTRTKNRTYIIVPQTNPSEFIKDFKNKNNVFVWSNKDIIEEIKCPICIAGNLVKRISDTNHEFVGCSNYPRCEFSNSNISILSNPKKCERCGGYLVPRKGKNGLFLGCTNYPLCTNSEELDANNRSEYQ